jgi:hypothetical protein
MHPGHSVEFLIVKECDMYNVGTRLLGSSWLRDEEAS